jgi:DNA polymerase-3 subunit beta
MRIRTKKKDMQDVLSKVIGVIPSKTTINVLTCFKFDADDVLKVTGTDLEISIIAEKEVEVIEKGSIAVSAKMLLDLIKELPDESILLYNDDKKLYIEGKGNYKIALNPVEDYPVIAENTVEYVDIPASIIKRMIEKTIFATSDDELRPQLTGVKMEFTEEFLSFVSTDGHRLSKITNDLVKGTGSAIVPTKTLHLLLKSMRNDVSVRVGITEDLIVFNTGDVVIYSKQISGTYPNYARIIPVDYTKSFTVDKVDFVSALKRIALFTNSLTRQCIFDITSTQMIIQADDIESGTEGNEVVFITGSEPIKIGMNSEYMMECLKVIDKSELKVEFSEPNRPLIVSQENNEHETFMMVLMPIRIQQ